VAKQKSVGMFGDNVVFDDYPISEGVWSSLPDDIKEWFYQHGAKPIYTPHLFPAKVNMLTTYGMLPEEAEAKYKEYGLDNPPQGVLGRERYYPEWLTKELVEQQGLSEKEISTIMDITDLGERASTTKDWFAGMPTEAAPKIEEYFHYLDEVMGDVSTPEFPIDLGGLSGIMSNHIDRLTSQGWKGDTDELLNEWMKDPFTEHLEVEDAPDWSHHGNKINPRLEFGKFLIEALTDKNFEQWAAKSSKEGIKNPHWEGSRYWEKPMEIVANAARPLIQNTGIDEYRRIVEGGGFEGVEKIDPIKGGFITEFELKGLDRGLANAISVYLNAQAREEQEQSPEQDFKKQEEMTPKGHLNFPYTPTMQPSPISEPTRQPSPPIQKSIATPVRYLQQFQQLKKAGAPVRRTGSKYGFGL
jgi:hypothetical protein